MIEVMISTTVEICSYSRLHIPVGKSITTVNYHNLLQKSQQCCFFKHSFFVTFALPAFGKQVDNLILECMIQAMQLMSYLETFLHLESSILAHNHAAKCKLCDTKVTV